MASESSAAGVSSTPRPSKPCDGHAVCDPRAGYGKRINVAVRIAGGKSGVTAKGGRRKGGGGRLGMSRVVLGLLLLEVGLLELLCIGTI